MIKCGSPGESPSDADMFCRSFHSRSSHSRMTDLNFKPIKFLLSFSYQSYLCLCEAWLTPSYSLYLKDYMQSNSAHMRRNFWASSTTPSLVWSTETPGDMFAVYYYPLHSASCFVYRDFGEICGPGDELLGGRQTYFIVLGKECWNPADIWRNYLQKINTVCHLHDELLDLK